MNKIILYRYIIIFSMIIETFPVLWGYLYRPGAMLMIVVIVISFLCSMGESFVNKQTIALFVYFLVIAFSILFDSNWDYIAWAVKDFLLPITFLCIINTLLYNHDIVGLKIITTIGLVIIFILTICTLVILTYNPSAIRDSVLITDNQLFNKGLVDYSLVHGLPFLFPLIIYNLKKKRKLYKLFPLAFIVVTYFMLLFSGFTAAIIAGTFSIVFAFFIFKSMKKNIILCVFLILFLVFFLNDYIIQSVLSSIEPLFTNTPYVYTRISDLQDSINSGYAEGHVNIRFERYNIAWDAFINNPFFGNFQGTGGHSFLIDRLASYGIIGAFPFFLFLYFSLKKNYTLIPEDSRPYYMISIIIFIILALSKNLGGIQLYLYLLVFLPGLAFLGLSKSKQYDNMALDSADKKTCTSSR
jgi:O-antigen ligase/polysaccharide polymerase Wzy-like membrane protein